MQYFFAKLRTVPAWFYAVALIALGFAGVAIAAPPAYTPLVGIPGITNSGAKSIGEYINALYLFTISVGGLIGVVKISMAGVKYSMSDVVTDKGEAKKDIMGVLLGLAILLIPAVVLNTIYSGPDGKSGLTNLNVLESAPKVELKPSRGGTGGGPGTQPPGTRVVNWNCTLIPDTIAPNDEVVAGQKCTWPKERCVVLRGVLANPSPSVYTCTYNTGDPSDIQPGLPI